MDVIRKFKRSTLIIMTFITLFCLTPSAGFAVELKVTWNRVTPLANQQILGYRLYFRKFTQPTYDKVNSYDAANTNVVALDSLNLDQRYMTYYLVVTAYGTVSGTASESANSNEIVVVTGVLDPPTPPDGIIVSLYTSGHFLDINKLPKSGSFKVMSLSDTKSVERSGAERNNFDINVSLGKIPRKMTSFIIKGESEDQDQKYCVMNNIPEENDSLISFCEENDFLPIEYYSVEFEQKEGKIAIKKLHFLDESGTSMEFEMDQMTFIYLNQ